MTFIDGIKKKRDDRWCFNVNLRNCFPRNLNSIPGISRIFGGSQRGGKSGSFQETFPGKFRTVCSRFKVLGMKTPLFRTGELANLVPRTFTLPFSAPQPG